MIIWLRFFIVHKNAFESTNQSVRAGSVPAGHFLVQFHRRPVVKLGQVRIIGEFLQRHLHPHAVGDFLRCGGFTRTTCSGTSRRVLPPSAGSPGNAVVVEGCGFHGNGGFGRKGFSFLEGGNNLGTAVKFRAVEAVIAVSRVGSLNFFFYLLL